MKHLVKNPLFWVFIILFLLALIILDLSIQYYLTVKTLTSGRWGIHYLLIALFSILVDFYRNKAKSELRKDLKTISRLAFWVAVGWVYIDFGLKEAFYFMALIIISAVALKRVLKIVVK